LQTGRQTDKQRRLHKSLAEVITLSSCCYRQCKVIAGPVWRGQRAGRPRRRDDRQSEVLASRRRSSSVAGVVLAVRRRPCVDRRLCRTLNDVRARSTRQKPPGDAVAVAGRRRKSADCACAGGTVVDHDVESARPLTGSVRRRRR